MPRKAKVSDAELREIHSKISELSKTHTQKAAADALNMTVVQMRARMLEAAMYLQLLPPQFSASTKSAKKARVREATIEVKSTRGDGLQARIPNAVLEAFGVKLGDSLKVSVKRKQIILTAE